MSSLRCDFARLTDGETKTKPMTPSSRAGEWCAAL